MGKLPTPFPFLYPVTSDDLSGRWLVTWSEELFAEGCRFLQFRRKRGPDREALEDLRDLVARARRADCRVIVNDRVDLCLLAEADGVHLGQEDMPPQEARRLLGPGKVIGFSTHTLEQVERAADLPVDYLALGPVFFTASKENSAPPVSPGVQREAAAKAHVPLVAIGGITPERTGEVIERGFAGVAAIGALSTSPARGWRAFSRGLNLPDVPRRLQGSPTKATPHRGQGST